MATIDSKMVSFLEYIEENYTVDDFKKYLGIVLNADKNISQSDADSAKDFIQDIYNKSSTILNKKYWEGRG